MDVHYTLLDHEVGTTIIREVRGGVAAVEYGSRLLAASPYANSIKIQFNEENITINKKNSKFLLISEGGREPSLLVLEQQDGNKRKQE